MTKNISSIEKCAKLMGLGIIDGIAPIPTPDGQWREFNPLTNKSDLMDLECEMGIGVEWVETVVAPRVIAQKQIGRKDNFNTQYMTDHPDKFTARAHAVMAVVEQIYDRREG